MPVIPAPNRVERLSEINSAEIRLLKQQHRSLWKFYVFLAPHLASQRDAAGQACEEVIGQPNELPHQMRGYAPEPD
jgi:hypothetical protein